MRTYLKYCQCTYFLNHRRADTAGTFKDVRLPIYNLGIFTKHSTNVLIFLALVFLTCCGDVDGKVDPEAYSSQTRCQALPFCTHSFDAWQLRLYANKRDLPTARYFSDILLSNQQTDGDWGIGTDWGNGECDFREKIAEFAESWEVGEIAFSLHSFLRWAGNQKVSASVDLAGNWLSKRVFYFDSGLYLAHEPDANLVLQPHSTIVAALVFHQLRATPGYDNLAATLTNSGINMNFRRIGLSCPEITNSEINDYEKMQIGYYLKLMNLPEGDEILAGYENCSDFTTSDRGPAYFAMALHELGEFGRAREIARCAVDRLKVTKGYEVALADWLAYILENDF